MCSFKGRYPQKCPQFFGGNKRGNTYNTVQKIDIFSELLAIKNSLARFWIGSTRLNTSDRNGSCSKEGRLFEGAPSYPLYWKPYSAVSAQHVRRTTTAPNARMDQYGFQLRRYAERHPKAASGLLVAGTVASCGGSFNGTRLVCAFERGVTHIVSSPQRP